MSDRGAFGIAPGLQRDASSSSHRGIGRKMSMTRSTLLFLCMLFLRCDESLPLRLDPRHVFDARIQVFYSLTTLQNVLTIQMILVNRYDEVLEDVSTLSGQLQIDIPRFEGSERTFVLDAQSMSRVPYYNPSTGLLRVPPGDSVVFQVSYDWRDDSGRNLTALFTVRDDPNCSARVISDPELYRIRANATVFARASEESASLYVGVCWVNAWVNPKFCPPLVGIEGICAAR